MKRFVTLMLALMLLVSVGAGALAEADVSYTWWIARGEDTTFYDSYSENPVIQYLLRDSYAGQTIAIDFWQGISGAEKDNFNNMLSTDSLADVVDLTYSDYTPATLYEDGYIIDLTELVDEYMPNYSRLLEEDEALAEFAYSYVNGEKKILFITTYNMTESFAGFCYRRDWVAKYGGFNYGFDDEGNWYDDVIFPNGTDTPLYISDWEWMFELFTEALDDLGIDDGYCYSIHYTGAMGSGDLYSSFGGGCPWWYRDEAGNAAYGGNSENMRVYLEAMHTWWENGWIDKSFAQRSGDMYFSINSPAVHQGKVGLWIGRQSEIGNAMDIGDELTSGIMVYGAPQPINDVYGDDEQQNVIPNCFYSQPDYSIGVAITSTANGKDLEPLLTFMDRFFEPFVANLGNNGFSDRMIHEMDDNDPIKQMYLKFGLVDGMWYESDDGDAVGYFAGGVDQLLGNAMKCNRIPKLLGYDIKYTPESRSAELQMAIDLWDMYEAWAYLRDNVDGLIPTDQVPRKSKIDNNQRTYQAQSLPKFIMGESGFDIYSDTDWNNYCTVITKYGVDKVTEMYQDALEILER